MNIDTGFLRLFEEAFFRTLKGFSGFLAQKLWQPWILLGHCHGAGQGIIMCLFMGVGMGVATDQAPPPRF